MIACGTSDVDEVVSATSFSQCGVLRWRGDICQTAQDSLAEEMPVALIYNGISHAVMLATPQDLEDFALGFSLSEGILADKSELYGVETRLQVNGIELHCEIASERFIQLKTRRRTLAGKTGCGLCGAESLEQAMRYPVQLANQTIFNRSAIQLGLEAMPAQQMLQQKTGSTHACAWVSADGVILALREDVGRHNALDKLVGAIATHGCKPEGFVITTSRASYEMVQKTASVGISMLVAISAPTALAVRVADCCGLTLVGFARNNNYVVYSHPEYIN